MLKLACFVIPYLIATAVIVPPIAKLTGRVRLPISSQTLKPLSIWTTILNRNYVRPELLNAVVEVSREVHLKYPGTCVLYLDANFPFIDGFPLLPHLSHNDGKKLDLAFFYEDTLTHEPLTDAPSFCGYGICEEPTPDEVNTSLECAEKGYWQYSILRKIIPQGKKNQFQFNQTKTKELIEMISNENSIGKIFIEPHLKRRLQLSSEKIKFHGCQAVRHDDHLHIQLK